jgi:hypothetical protein
MRRKSIPVKNSTNIYLGEIGAEQEEHLPFRKIHDTRGIFS